MPRLTSLFPIKACQPASPPREDSQKKLPHFFYLFFFFYLSGPFSFSFSFFLGGGGRGGGCLGGSFLFFFLGVGGPATPWVDTWAISGLLPDNTGSH